MNRQTDRDEALRVAASMIRHGGSFAQHLGYALECADTENTKRIKEAFPECWKHYKNMTGKIHIDVVPQEDWDAHMRKTAQAAAEGQKVI